jgi:hypothetical protein
MRPRCPKAPPPQLGVNCPSVGLEVLADCVNGLVVWLALCHGQDGVRKSGDDVFDCHILHDVLFGGPECLFVLLIEKGDANSVGRDIALGLFF